MGSGKGKTSTVNPRTYEERDDMNDKMKDEYRVSLDNNNFYFFRDQKLREKRAELFYDDQNLLDSHRYAPYQTFVIPESFEQQYSIANKDKLIGFTDIFTPDDWEQIFRDLGGDDRSLLRVLEDAEILKEKPSVILQQNYSHTLDRLSRVMREEGAMPLEAVSIAIDNMFQGNHPYLYNPLARGRGIYDKEKSPTTIENRNIRQNLIQMMQTATELKNTFKESLPYVPFMGKKLHVHDDPYFHSGTATAYYESSTEKISISKSAIKGTEYTTRTYSIGTTAVDIFTHEFGHAVHDSLVSYYENPTLNASAKSIAYAKYKEYFSVKLGNAYKSGDLALEAVSPYGNTNKAEAFAESFVMYTIGEEPAKGAGDRYHAIFKSFMKDMGLEKYYGINRVYPLPETVSTAKTVKSKTLPTKSPSKGDTPQKKLIFNLGGKKYELNVSETAKKKGYTVKRVRNMDYFIDIYTGAILKIREVNRGGK